MKQVIETILGFLDDPFEGYKGADEAIRNKGISEFVAALDKHQEK